MTSYNERAKNLFWLLGNESRFKIVIQLVNNSDGLSISKIAKNLETAIPNINKSVDLLRQYDILQKDGNNICHLTSYGRQVTTHIGFFNFITENNDYFNGHDAGVLPVEFAQRMAVFAESERIQGVPMISAKEKEMLSNSKQYMHNILYEAKFDTDFLVTMKMKLEEGIRINTIYGKNSIVHPDNKELLKKIGFGKYLVNGQMEKKDKNFDIKVSVVVTDSEALIMFPSVNGKVDTTEAFYGKTKNLQAWCEQYFQYCWSLE